MEYTLDKKGKRIIINKKKYDYLCEMYITNSQDRIIDRNLKIVLFLKKKFFGYSREIHMFLPLNIDNLIRLDKTLNRDYSRLLLSDIGDEKLFLLYDTLEDKFYSNEVLIERIQSLMIMEKMISDI